MLFVVAAESELFVGFVSCFQTFSHLCLNLHKATDLFVDFPFIVGFNTNSIAVPFHLGQK